MFYTVARKNALKDKLIVKFRTFRTFELQTVWVFLLRLMKECKIQLRGALRAEGHAVHAWNIMENSVFFFWGFGDSFMLSVHWYGLNEYK